MLSSKRHSLPSRPEPPKWDSIHQDIEGAADDDVAFSYFSLRREGNLDESAASFETQISPEDDEDELTEQNANGTTPSTSGLRHRFGEVIASPTAIDVSSAISNVMAAASDALHKQKTPSVDAASAAAEDASASTEGLAGEEEMEDVAAAVAAAAAAPSKAKVEETYRRVLSFLEANQKLEVMLGKREEKKLFDQSFESVGEGRDEDFLDPVNDDDDDGDNDDEDMFRDDDDDDEDSMAITSLGALAGGDTIAECSHYLPKDKQDNFQDLVSKLDKLKGELTVELAGLMEKTSAT